MGAGLFRIPIVTKVKIVAFENFDNWLKFQSKPLFGVAALFWTVRSVFWRCEYRCLDFIKPDSRRYGCIAAAGGKIASDDGASP